jgi:hypothetical protein
MEARRGSGRLIVVCAKAGEYEAALSDHAVTRLQTDLIVAINKPMSVAPWVRINGAILERTGA